MTNISETFRDRTAVTEWTGLVARLVLGGVWIVAGASKVTALDESVRAVLFPMPPLNLDDIEARP